MQVVISDAIEDGRESAIRSAAQSRMENEQTKVTLVHILDAKLFNIATLSLDSYRQLS